MLRIILNLFLDVVIGFSEDFYTGRENPNSPCCVAVVVAVNILEIPLPIRLTPSK